MAKVQRTKLTPVYKEVTAINVYDLMDKLPHGSGINDKWEYTKDTRGKYHFHNTFDYMDENGFYDAYIPFEVVMYKTEMRVIMHAKTNHHKYVLWKSMLKDYLEHIFNEWFIDNTPIYKIVEDD